MPTKKNFNHFTFKIGWPLQTNGKIHKADARQTKNGINSNSSANAKDQKQDKLLTMTAVQLKSECKSTTHTHSLSL